MKSKWRVMYNPTAESAPYGVYRLYDVQKIMCSENIDLYGYFETKTIAENTADEMNRENRKKKKIIDVTIEEMCPYCDNYNEFPISNSMIATCPDCGKKILLCSTCDPDRSCDWRKRETDTYEIGICHMGNTINYK